jgi:serine/threonine-protein kinase
MRARTDKPPYKKDDVIGEKYRIARVLAEGGFSIIYEAVDTTVGRTVAVKVLRPGIARIRTYSREQMRRECQVLVQLHQVTANVVDVLTAGITDDGLPYYVMELLKGSSMRRSIDEKQRRAEAYTIEEVLSFGITIAMALVHAHGLGVVHRDLKPENVFLALTHGGGAVLKLLDFGICIDLAAESELSEQARFTCSLPYAAPEQIEGQRAMKATDVYALGLMLIEMLTLRLPHGRDVAGLTAERLELALADEPLPDLSALRSDAPARLVRLLARCLASSPESRPTAHDVAKELRDIGLQMRGKLGPQENSTDVDEPTIEELHRRMEAASGSKGSEARVVAGAAPVDLHATTEDPPSSPREEVFFVRRDPAATAPVAKELAPEGAPAATPGIAYDLTTPDPLPPFSSAAPFVEAGAPTGVIIGMPLIDIRDPVVLPSAPRVEHHDAVYVDPDNLPPPLEYVRAVAGPSDSAPEGQPRPSWIKTGPLVVPTSAPNGAPPLAPLYPPYQAYYESTSRSEPGAWQAPAQAPAPKRPRDRVILALAFAAPVLIGLALAPLLFRRATSPKDHAPPPDVIAMPSATVPAPPAAIGSPSAIVAAPPPSPPSQPASIAGTQPVPSPSAHASARSVRSAANLPKPATTATARTDIQRSLDDDEYRLFPSTP